MGFWKSQFEFLANLATQFKPIRFYSIQEKVINYIDKYNLTKQANYIDLHFYNNTLLDFYYKPHNNDKTDIENAKRACNQDINLVID